MRPRRKPMRAILSLSAAAPTAATPSKKPLAANWTRYQRTCRSGPASRSAPTAACVLEWCCPAVTRTAGFTQQITDDVPGAHRPGTAAEERRPQSRLIAGRGLRERVNPGGGLLVFRYCSHQIAQLSCQDRQCSRIGPGVNECLFVLFAHSTHFCFVVSHLTDRWTRRVDMRGVAGRKSAMNLGRPFGPLKKETLMLRNRLFGIVAVLLVVGLAGCRHCSSCSKSASPGGCSSCSKSASASCPHVAPGSPPCASCAAHAAAPIPGPVER